MSSELAGFSVLRPIGSTLVFVGLAFLVWTFGPVILEEVKYALYHPAEDLSRDMIGADGTEGRNGRAIVPVDPEFGIVIPKIGANAPVIADVDPFDPAIYQSALKRGVAHAKGTSLPGGPGNAFFFAHSSNDIAGPGRYNTVFYLLGKMNRGDRFGIAFQGRLFMYRVTDILVVSPENVDYLGAVSEASTATLMTCTPAGTTLRRLLVVGTLEESDEISP